MPDNDGRAEIVSSVAAPKGGHLHQVRKAERELSRWTWLSMLMLAPLVLSFLPVACVALNVVLRALAFAVGASIALAAVEGPFIVILIALDRENGRALAGGVAVGAGRLCLALLIVAGVLSVLPLGPYGFPLILGFLNPFVALVALVLVSVFVVAQRRLIRYGSILRSTSAFAPARWWERYDYLPFVFPLVGFIANMAIHATCKQIAGLEDRRPWAYAAAASRPHAGGARDRAVGDEWTTRDGAHVRRRRMDVHDILLVVEQLYGDLCRPR